MNKKKMNTGNTYHNPSIFFGAKSRDLLQIEAALVDNPHSINEQDVFGLTALHYAAVRGYGEIVDYLLIQPGARVDLRDEQGRDALDVAILSGDEDVLASLFRFKADEVDAADKPGDNAPANLSGQVVPLKPKRP